MNAPTPQRDYCEWCGDDLVDGKHQTVQRCVGLCDKCGGLRPDDDRWASEVDDRCECLDKD